MRIHKFANLIILTASVALSGCSGAAKKPSPAHRAHKYNYEFRGVVDGHCTVASTGIDAASGRTIVYCVEGAH